MVKKLIERFEGLDEPLPLGEASFLQKIPVIKRFIKSGKLRVWLINEDSSIKEYFKMLPDSYILDIKKKVCHGQY